MRKEYFTEILSLDQVDSTNSYLNRSQFEDKTLVYSLNQTAGKGRLDRKWENFPGKNLALSIGRKFPKVNPFWMTAALSVALIDTLQDYGIENGWIKWPNDVYVGRGKIAGVLTESRWKENQIQQTVCGIGVNINTEEKELKENITDKKTTSLYCETGKTVNIENFIDIFLDNIVNCLLFIDQNQIEQLKERWISFSEVVGEKAILSEVYRGSPTITGTVTGIDNEGVLYFYDGTNTFPVVAGDVSILSGH